MPRVETTKLSGAGSQPYHMSYDAPSSSASSCSSSSSGTPPAKKKHVCAVCDRAFTTSGHLARHSRVHTGERNHKCPFPGCETRCSRQDNLQQHYRIHLSPGSRRSSGRAGARASSGTARRVRAVSTASVETASPVPPSSPPALEPARLYQDAPPDSPPPLAPATLPVGYDSSSPRSGADSASPEPNYSMLPPLSHSVGVTSTGPYTYRTVSASYQEDENDAYGYSSGGSYGSYSTQNEYPSSQNVSHLASPALPQMQTRESSPISQLSSRHSISHISHPQPSYLNAHSGSSTLNPPSPASSHSVQSSAPPSPPYSTFSDAGQNTAYPVSSTQISSQSVVQATYGLPTDASRYASPPPTLAPIHDGRAFPMRRSTVQRHHSMPFIHHPQPLATEFGYHSSMSGLSHGAWKAEHGMRRGLVG